MLRDTSTGNSENLYWERQKLTKERDDTVLWNSGTY